MLAMPNGARKVTRIGPRRGYNRKKHPLNLFSILLFSIALGAPDPNIFKLMNLLKNIFYAF